MVVINSLKLSNMHNTKRDKLSLQDFAIKSLERYYQQHWNNLLEHNRGMLSIEWLKLRNETIKETD